MRGALFSGGLVLWRGCDSIDHVYGREGRYIVTLNVTDIYGSWNVTSSPVAVTYRTDTNGVINILDIALMAGDYVKTV